MDTFQINCSRPGWGNDYGDHMNRKKNKALSPAQTKLVRRKEEGGGGVGEGRVFNQSKSRVK